MTFFVWKAPLNYKMLIARARKPQIYTESTVSLMTLMTSAQEGLTPPNDQETHSIASYSLQHLTHYTYNVTLYTLHFKHCTLNVELYTLICIHNALHVAL